MELTKELTQIEKAYLACFVLLTWIAFLGRVSGVTLLTQTPPSVALRLAGGVRAAPRHIAGVDAGAALADFGVLAVGVTLTLAGGSDCGIERRGRGRLGKVETASFLCCETDQAHSLHWR